MNNKPERMPNETSFVCFVASAVPMVFDNSLSYYEALCALWKYIQDMTDVVNNNATLEEEFIDKVNELETYVNTYFDNLDVQEEINNKLDEMTEDGTLQELIDSYLQPNVTWTFDTVADMQASTNLVEGCFARTLGFNSLNDGGSSIYSIKDITGVTTNGYDKIAINDDLYAELSVQGSVYPEQFGCVADGTTDDTLAFQACVDFAHNNDISVELNEKTYLLNSGVTIYSKTNINGNNGSLKSTADAPILKSTSPINTVHLNNINFIGADDSTKTSNIGLDIVPFYSSFENLNFTKLYYGVYLRTTGASGTLVENRFTNINVRECCGGLYLGGADNNKLTDGFLNNIVAYTTDSTVPAIYIGSSAGWNINEIHTYGNCSTGMYVKNGWRTNISNIYLESTASYSLYVDSMQLGVSLTNAHIQCKTDTAIAIMQRNASYMPLGETSMFNVVNLITTAPLSSTANIVDAVKISIVNHTHYGGGTKLVASDTSVSKIVDSISVRNHKLTDDNAGKRLLYNNFIVNLFATDTLDASSGNEKTLTIPIPFVPYSYNSRLYRFKIMTYQYWDGGTTCNYEADVSVINKGGNYSVKSTTTSSTTMFTSAPAFSYSDGNLIVKFTPNTALQGSYRLY